MNEHHTHRIDKIGMILSGICLAHCILLPPALALLPFLGVSVLQKFSEDDSMHFWLAVILFGVGSTAFLQGFFRHRNPVPLLLGAIGTILLFLGALNPNGLLPGNSDHAATILGGITLISAHWKNSKFHCQKPS